ncbi:MAG: TIGR04211 family SH3 domain-containing protein [Psychromonas sp.]
MKKIKYIFTALLLTFSISSFADVRYISDDVFIYLHSGPSLEYRIIGTLTVGAKVSTLEYDKKTKFIQIKSLSGKIGWMKVSQLQQGLPAKVLLPSVQNELKITREKLDTIDATNMASIADEAQLFQQQLILVDNLKQEKSLLQQQILDLKSRNLELDLLQETEDASIQMQWLLNGGGVLFFGLLIGLMIPFLPRRKKRSSNW